MKKYRIEFAKNYGHVIEKAKLGNQRAIRELKKHKDEIELIEKWNGKEITILELEKHINIFEEVIFDGATILVYNGYVE